MGRDDVEPNRRLKDVAVAWFPPDQWPLAVERWPDLLDDLPPDHGGYSHEIEARVKRMARHLSRFRLHISPVTVDGLDEQAAAEGDDPGSAEARSLLAADVLSLGQAIRWPPGRNEPCWCRSGRRYRQCCGPVPALPDDPDPA